jgi:hypothetical protein
MQYLLVGAWPGTLSSSHLQTVFEESLLQMWDSHWLHNPQSSLMGFLNGVSHAARQHHGTQVSLVCCACTMLEVCPIIVIPRLDSISWHLLATHMDGVA